MNCLYCLYQSLLSLLYLPAAINQSLVVKMILISSSPYLLHFEHMVVLRRRVWVIRKRSSNVLHSGSLRWKPHIFQRNGFSIKKWKTIYFSKKWFLNQKMENYIFFKEMVSQSKNGKLYIFQKNGFSIMKWFNFRETIFWKKK